MTPCQQTRLLGAPRGCHANEREARNVKFLIACMRGILFSFGITPPSPENERKTLLLLLLLLLGLVAATWLVFKYLLPHMA